MLTIRKRVYHSNSKRDLILSRLDWKVEKVKRLTNPLFGHLTTYTKKTWVGKIDRESWKFRIIQTGHFFSPRILEGNFFQLFVHGYIEDEGERSKITMEFRLGWNNVLFFILLYLFVINQVVVTYINQGDLSSVLMLAFVPIVVTLLLIIQLNRTENKLIDTFDV
jgi:hypothetical protein